MGLREYIRKRNFKQTPEPTGGKTQGGHLIFVVQKHAASSLHYDFRLEMDGVLKSWAVPKGPSTDPSVKRLAMMVEDHPFDYRDFEGTIAEGNYGAGAVIVWDRGTYEPLEPIEGKKAQEKHLLHLLKEGKLKFRLNGEKLRGEFALVKTGMGKNTWLLIKHKDDYADEGDITELDQSVLTKRTVEEVGKGKKAKAKGQGARGKAITESPHHEITESANHAISSSRPFPKTFRPMLATLSEPFEREGWLYELKWDGYRAITLRHEGETQLLSRAGKSFEGKYPAVYEAVRDWDIEGIVDGEIVVMNDEGRPDFNALQNWKGQAKGQLFYYVFDLLWLDGHDLTRMPLEQRRELLRQRLPKDKNSLIRFSDNFDTSAAELLKAVRNMGMEGIIAKRSGSLYFPGDRSDEWLKMKTQQRQEVVIGGFIRLDDSPKAFSSLLVGVFENGKFRYAGKVGTGFSHQQQLELLRQFKPHIRDSNPFEILPKVSRPAHFRAHPSGLTVTWLEPKLVAEVHYTEITPDKILRHPAFIALREDKAASEVVLEEPKPASGKNSPMEKPVTHAFTPPSKSGKKHRPLLDPDEAEQVKTVKGKPLKFTNLDKLYWPEEGITKRDLLNYYDRVSPYMMPYLLDRPMSLHRHPDGYKGPGFYQKDVRGKVPDWAETMPYESEEEKGVKKEFLVCTDEAALLYMANLGCIEINPWSSTAKNPDFPDWCILDLDPDKKTDFDRVIEVAQTGHALLEDAGIPSFCKTSGSTGLHLYIPLAGQYTYDQSQEFARLIAAMIMRRLPKWTSMERVPAKRRGKLYLDFLQNKQQGTVAAPYSVRPKAGATVSMPLHWEEVKPGLSMSDFTLKNVPELLQERGDIFRGSLGAGIDMQAALEKLEAAWG